MLIYVHIPFCKKKCRYCNFCSTVPGDVERYLRALKKEITDFCAEHAEAADRTVESVYFGGGTPSVLEGEQLGEILDVIRKNFRTENAEITAEGNPESLTCQKLKVWRDAGVNRVSIGVQSLDDETLAAIGRLHDKATALKAVRSAADILENVSADLIAGLPYQTPEKIKNDVLSLANCGIKHLSCYGLKVEEGTPLFGDVQSKRVNLPDDDLAADIFDAAHDTLLGLGFSRYEVSNFALPDHSCAHNIGYWKRVDYVGFGLSAHSLLDGKRYANFSAFDKYYQAAESGKQPVETQLELTFEDKVFETIMLSFRLCEGLSFSSFDEEFGFSFLERYASQLTKHAAFFDVSGDRISLNRRGMEIMNTILVDFLN